MWYLDNVGIPFEASLQCRSLPNLCPRVSAQPHECGGPGNDILQKAHADQELIHRKFLFFQAHFCQFILTWGRAVKPYNALCSQTPESSNLYCHYHHSRHVEDLLDRFPPTWLSSLGTHCPFHETFLVTICHPPPFPHLDVLGHSLHVSFIVIPNIFESRKKNARVVVPEDAVCATSLSAQYKETIKEAAHILVYCSP